MPGPCPRAAWPLHTTTCAPLAPPRPTHWVAPRPQGGQRHQEGALGFPAQAVPQTRDLAMPFFPLRRYFHEYFPKAIAVAEELRGRGGRERLVFMTHVRRGI